MKNKLKIAINITLLIISIIIASTIGEDSPRLYQILGFDALNSESIEYTILHDIRLPRIITAICVGALLSLSGLIMQCIFRNPLVEPYTMGLSGGAVLGVAIVFCCGIIESFGIWAINIGALLGALLTMLLILSLRQNILHDTTKMLLCGIMISFATSSTTTLIMSLTTHENLSQIITWTMGSFDNSTENQTIILGVFAIIATIIATILGNILNIISLGNTQAQHIGINVRVIIPLLFIFATLIASISVAYAGIIAFIGMIVPHISRIIFGHDNRLTAPMSAIGGATFMLICDTIAHHAIYPREIPVGVISGILGGIMFIKLASKKA